MPKHYGDCLLFYGNAWFNLPLNEHAMQPKKEEYGRHFNPIKLAHPDLDLCRS